MWLQAKFSNDMFTTLIIQKSINGTEKKCDVDKLFGNLGPSSSFSAALAPTRPCQRKREREKRDKEKRRKEKKRQRKKKKKS